MPIDPEVASRLLSQLRKHFRTLDSLRSRTPAELLGDPAAILAVEHGLQLMIQALTDLSLHICSALDVAGLETYRDAARGLRELGFLTSGQADLFEGMIGLRNLLVHAYAEVDEARLVELARTRLDDLLALADSISDELRRRGAL